MSLPRLPARDPHEPHRTATQLELLFDLISVIAIAAITHSLAQAIEEGHGLAALPAFAFLFVAIWWAWMNFTWFASAFDADGFFYRVLVMVIMAGELIFAGGVQHIFATFDFGFGILGWVLMRIGMATLWLRASANADYRRTCLRYAGGIVVAQLAWVALYFTTAPGSTAFFGFAMLIWLIEFSVPPFAEAARVTPFHRHHIIERYGLLTIITLGEIMLSISHGFGTLFESSLSFAAAGTALAALAIVFSIFWLYFSEEEHLVSSQFSHAFIWGYGHVFIFAAIAALGAGISAEIVLSAHAAEAHGAAGAPGPGVSVAWFVGAPMALIFAGLWTVRDRHYRLGARAAALPVMALAALGGAAAGLPTVGFALIAILALLWRVPVPRPAKAPAPAREVSH